MKKFFLVFYGLILVILFFGPVDILQAQVKGKKLAVSKVIEDEDCNKCRLQKKNAYCFTVSSFVGNVRLTDNSGKPLDAVGSDSYETGMYSKQTDLYLCARNSYQEITASVKNYPDITFSLTPDDFKNGIPIVMIYEDGTKPFQDKSSEEKGDQLFNILEAAEKKVYTQKTYSKAECDYCLPLGERMKCLMIVTSIKGARVMDKDIRVPHTKVLKINDSVYQYIFCIDPSSYQKLSFKAKGYQISGIEVIPRDYTRNRTPVLMFYDETQKSFFESNGKTHNVLYSKKSNERWPCKTCDKENTKTACIYVYTYLNDIVLYDENNTISPKEIKKTDPLLKRYSFCVDPNTANLYVQKEGFERHLLKIPFEDFETIGGTTVVLSENEEELDVLLEGLEMVKEDIKIQINSKEQKEFRVQIIAKMVNDYSNEEIQALYNLPYEVKEDFDDVWHRFTIGSFSQYEDAFEVLNEFEKSSHLSGAFIVLYINGKRIGPYKP